MRLLNTRTLELDEFIGDSIPEYVILSHTWESEEVSYQEMQAGVGKSKAGYAKIERCCQQARADGYQYAWIDTCCIDKTSSAELIEAINSMFGWYEKAHICYAYLSDVTASGSLPFVLTGNNLNEFKKSRWMHRGWTLQELLAPKSVEFYDSNWHGIGTKSTFATTLAEVTGIALGALKGAPLSSFTVAHRMSWAAQRKTTRSEDTSYCLFGLFGVNLPLLYGEGEERAFIRLQEEILKVTEDYTIFAWTDAAGPVWDPVTHGPFIAPPGLLATSVTLFRDLKLSQELNLDHWLLESARHSDLIKSDAMLYADQPPMLTSRGLRITLLVQGGREGLSAREIRAQFYCLLRTRDGTLQQKPLVLHLRSSGQHNLYQRITRGALGLSIMESHQLDPFVPTTIYVEQEQKHSASITQILNKISPATMFELTLQGVEIVNSTPSIRYEAQNSFAGAPLQFSRPFAVLDPSSGCAVMLVRGFSKYALVGVGFLNGQSWCVVDAADESDFSELDKKMHTLSSSIDMVLPNLFCDGTSFNYESVLINATVKRRPSRIVYIAPGYGARFNLYCLSITALQH